MTFLFPRLLASIIAIDVEVLLVVDLSTASKSNHVLAHGGGQLEEQSWRHVAGKSRRHERPVSKASLDTFIQYGKYKDIGVEFDVWAKVVLLKFKSHASSAK